MMNKFKIIWSSESKRDLRKIKNNLSKSRLKSISLAPRQIVFPDQFQIDEYRKDCRRIIEGNYKILYQFKNDEIRIIKIFNSLHDPINSLL
ncbi:type II toxin-antitoxin system RelE/ParE family toxin [Flavobacterium sp.]|uniref:type II toxin-antitoxin system RelE/ParE family toxin n=1 Tax=Flavobacterium sp. TaxID=239 RepID=UPI00286E10C3|nr:type II toxin-antitoxin system RelE/ParE family toxin [Flavobacterium sp.]